MADLIVLSCSICSKPFLVKQSKAYRRRHCGKSCFYKAKVKPKPSAECATCGAEFVPRIRAGYQQRFCSRKCWRLPLNDRFWAKVDKASGLGPQGTCWEWQASLNSDGYGNIGIEQMTDRAHRLSWRLHYGPIPDGLSVLHKCDNPPCVRPDHLFLGTQADNVHDMQAKGRDRKSRYFSP